jgi:hypothetical protein
MARATLRVGAIIATTHLAPRSERQETSRITQRLSHLETSPCVANSIVCAAAVRQLLQLLGIADLETLAGTWVQVEASQRPGSPSSRKRLSAWKMRLAVRLAVKRTRKPSTVTQQEVEIYSSEVACQP